MTRTVRIVTCCLLAAAPIVFGGPFGPRPARAADWLDCVVPTRIRGTGANAPEMGEIRRAALAIEAVHKRNTVFMAGNHRPIRVRTTIDLFTGEPGGAIVNTVAYAERAWVKGQCAVIPQADIGGDMTDGALHAVINDPRSFLATNLGDPRFVAFEEPKRTGQFAGFDVYEGMYLLMSRSGRVPWVPVTVTDALAREERRFREQQEDWTAQKARSGLTPEKIQEAYDTLRTFDPAGAEAQRAALTKVMQEEKVQRARQEDDGDARFAAVGEALRAYRASLQPAQLAAQARLGAPGPDSVVRVDDPTGRKLVKPDPAFGRSEPTRVHLLRIFRGALPQDPVPGRYLWQVKAYDTTDHDALAALLK